ncbi:peptidoglycan-binding protein [Alteribacter lacisalsi]|uniref:Peptidoglycan-binding protein n=1 Tax=Alteribacter lacisalsi TaxID=2045244 RepID=A0A2W0HN79_9BACI|nr:cell wall hydrolase [Alteribacter lacisalsi]PYZ98339.1 peptidoglycan-binding protein [Alteribacter lacisalsi]
MKKWLAAGTFVLAAFLVPNNADASSGYTVQSGDTLWGISQKFGITVEELKANNGLADTMIYPGDTLVTGEAVRNDEKVDLLSRLVHSEARGEPYEGKVAVAAVVLNRIESGDFPDSMNEVIYETNGNSYAFEPVMNGSIYNEPDSESVRAAEEALNGYDPSNGALFFYNPDTATSDWVNRLTIDSRIGNHVFASN